MHEESACFWTENNCILLKCHACSITTEAKTYVHLEAKLASPFSGWSFSQAKGQMSQFGKHHIISACAASVLHRFKY